MNHDGTTDTASDGDQQRWIDELLRSSVAAELEAAPVAAIVATRARIRAIRRRRAVRRSVLGLAAAAAVAGLAAWPSAPLPRREGSGEGLKTGQSVAARDDGAMSGNPSPSPSLRGRGIDEELSFRRGGMFVAGSDAIAVPLVSDAADVTIVQLYPTTDAERRWRLARQLEQILSESNGG